MVLMIKMMMKVGEWSVDSGLVAAADGDGGGGDDGFGLGLMQIREKGRIMMLVIHLL